MAILVREKGACSLDDGCGLLVNKNGQTVNANPEGHNQYTGGSVGVSEKGIPAPKPKKSKLSKMSIAQADAKLREKGHSLTGKGHFDLASMTAHHEVQHPDGSKEMMPVSEIAKLVGNQELSDNGDVMPLDDAKRAAIWNQLGQFLLNGGGGGGEQTSPAVVQKGFGKKAKPTVLDPQEEEPTDDDAVVTANQLDAIWLTYNRDWPQSKRDELDEDDFAGPDQSFPISTQEDLDAAVHSIGRSKHDPVTIKAGIKRIAERKGLQLPESMQTDNAHPQQARHSQTGVYQPMAHTAAKQGYENGFHADKGAPATLVGPANGPGDDGRNQTKIKRIKPIDIDGDGDGPHDDDGYAKIDEEEEHTAEVPDMPSKRPASLTGNADDEAAQATFAAKEESNKTGNAVAKQYAAKAWYTDPKDPHRHDDAAELHKIAAKIHEEQGDFRAARAHDEARKKHMAATTNRYHADVNEHVGPCTECGGEISGGVCKDCGHEPTTNAMKRCPECGGKMVDGECEECGYGDEDTENCAMGGPTAASGISPDNMNVPAGQAPVAASKYAAMASMDHPPAREPAIQAHDAAQAGDSAAAVPAHQEAAAAHDKAAAKAVKGGDIQGVNANMQAAMLHRKAAAMHAATTNENPGPYTPGQFAMMDAHNAADKSSKSANAKSGHANAGRTSHGAAAKAHKEASEAHAKAGNKGAALHHEKMAKRHGLAKSGEKVTTNEEQVNNMALTLNQIQGMNRDQLLVMLTRNCKCDKERGAFPLLNTDTLRKLAVANAKVQGSNADGSGDPMSKGINSGGWDKPHTDEPGYTNDPGKGLDGETDDEAEGDFEDESDGGKHPATENHQRRQQVVANRQEQLKTLPPWARRAILRGADAERREKNIIVNQLVGHIPNPTVRKERGNWLMRKGIDELKTLRSMLPVQNVGHDGYPVDDEPMPVANYGGADSFNEIVANDDGGTPTANADADDIHCMTANRTMNWAEISIANSSGRSDKWKRFLAGRNGTGE